MPIEQVEALEQVLQDAGRDRTSTRSTRAPPHGYSMADTSMYDEAGTERHFSVLRDLLRRARRLA